MLWPEEGWRPAPIMAAAGIILQYAARTLPALGGLLVSAEFVDDGFHLDGVMHGHETRK